MISDDSSASGMSVLELLLAVTMLVVFTGVVAAVMEITLRFMGESECPVDISGVRRCNDENTEDIANGALINRQRIELLFDELESVLVQPGIHRSRIQAISGVLGDRPAQPACTPAATTSFWAATVPELPVLTFPRGITFVCGGLGYARHPWRICLTPVLALPHLAFMFSRPCRLS